MDLALKQRVIGVTVWVALAVIFVPFFFDGTLNTRSESATLPIIPQAPAAPPVAVLLPKVAKSGTELAENHHNITRTVKVLSQKKNVTHASSHPVKHVVRNTNDGSNNK